MPETQDFQLNVNDEEGQNNSDHSNENTDTELNDSEQNVSENDLSQIFSPPVPQQSFANSTIPSYFQLVDPMLYTTLNDQNPYSRQMLPNNSQTNVCKATSERQHSGEKSVTQEEQQYIINVAHLHFPGAFNLVGSFETWKFEIFIH